MPRIIKELNGFDRYTWVTTVYLLVSTAGCQWWAKLSEQLDASACSFVRQIRDVPVGSAMAGASRPWIS